ncbi:MAG: hypothetical protein QOF16_1777, partial [Actinomycetota bacterium]|nr:hypothetical protein [Actinomycetota bacterium]
MGVSARARRASIALGLIAALGVSPQVAAAPRVGPTTSAHTQSCLHSAELGGDAHAALSCIKGRGPGPRTSSLAPAPVPSVPAILPSGTDGCAASGVDDQCEAWSTAFQDDAEGAGSYQFPRDIATSPDGKTVYIAAEDVVPAANGFDSKSIWAIVAYDTATGAQRWIAHWGDPSGYSIPVAITAGSNAVYATGMGSTSFSDVDSHLTTIAFSPVDGSQLWRSTYDGPNNVFDNGTHVALDPRGKNVYVAGVSAESNASDLDYVVLGYDATTGAQEWATRWAGIGTGGDDSPFGMALSPNGHMILATGWSAGPGDYNVDYGTIAVAADGPRAGTLEWQARYDGVGGHAPDRADAVGVSPNGREVFVTGLTSMSGDFSVNYGYGTVAYDATTGAQLWDARKQWTGTNFDEGGALSAGPHDRVFVTGQVTTSSTPHDLDFGTIAYDATSGAELWSQRYGGTGDDLELGNAIAAAPDGSDVYVTGISSNSKTANLFPEQRTQSGDEVTLGYDAATGAQRWVARYNTTGYDFDLGEEMALTPDGSMLFTAGTFKHNLSTDQNFYDAGVLAYNVAAPFSPPPPQEEDTSLAFTDRSASGAPYSEPATFEARLTDAGGDPVPDATVTFTLAGDSSNRSFSTTTNDDGVATVTQQITEKPGSYQLTARYEGEPDTFGPSDATTPFTVAKQNSSLSLTVTGNGSNRTLIAYLTNARSTAP